MGDGSRWGVKISLIPQEAPLGLAHALLTAEEFLAKEPFVMYLGDNILANGIESLVGEFREKQPPPRFCWPVSRIPSSSESRSSKMAE